MAPTLGYWNIRSKGEIIRLLLTYTGTVFEDKRYNIGPATNYDRSQWLNDKFNLDLDFPNLPYYLDGDLKMTQSLAIMRHIARKNRLDGQNEKEKARIDVIEQQVTDMNDVLYKLVYDPNFEKLKADYLKNLDTNLQLLSKFLGERPFMAGDSVTYVDFMAYELLDRMRLLSPESLEKVANVKIYIERVEALPEIAKYLKSSPRESIYGPLAKWMPMKV